jgi:hypothetical protein
MRFLERIYCLGGSTGNLKTLEVYILQGFQGFKRVGGIEPPSLAWKAKVLPLNYTRAGFLELRGTEE